MRRASRLPISDETLCAISNRLHHSGCRLEGTAHPRAGFDRLRSVELLHVGQRARMLILVRTGAAILENDDIVAAAKSPHRGVLHAGMRPGACDDAGLDVQFA